MRSVEPCCPDSLHPALPTSEASIGGLPSSWVKMLDRRGPGICLPPWPLQDGAASGCEST